MRSIREKIAVHNVDYCIKFVAIEEECLHCDLLSGSSR